MTDSMSSSFDDLWDQASEEQKRIDLEEWIIGKETVYEDRMVKQVVIKTGLATSLPSLVREYRELTGDKQALLTFNWFHETWPSFPVRLCCTSWAKAHEITIVDLYKRLTNTLMYKKFMEAKEFIPDGELLTSWGLIFPWNGLGTMILHNSDLTPQGTRFMKEIGNTGQIVYLDILTPFIDAIRSRWSP